MKKDITFETKYQRYRAFLKEVEKEKSKSGDKVIKTIAVKQPIMSVVTDNRALSEQYGRMTMIDVLSMKPKSMKAMALEYGTEGIEAVLSALMERCYGNFGQVVRDSVLNDLAINILNSEYYFLSLEDVFVCLKELERTEVSFKLTPVRIFKALAAYADRRLKAAAELSYTSHISNKPRALDVMDMNKDFREQQKAAMQKYKFEQQLKIENQK